MEQSERYARYREIIRDMRLMDDEFFSEALNGKIAPVEYKSATKRSIKLDIQAVDAEGRVMDIEVQRADKGASVRRARFHSSTIDRTLLEKGDEFDALVDTYVIFITEHDKFGADLPLYHVERTIPELNHTSFGDGAHILYVNGAFRDLNHPVGRLMHDMNCTRAEDMLNPLLAEEVRYLKENEGGSSYMCRAIEELQMEAKIEGEREAKINTAKNFLAMGNFSIEDIAKGVGLPVEEVRALAGKKSA